MYIVKIILPYLQQKRKELDIPPDSCGLLLIDSFKGQCNEKLLKFFGFNSINVVMVPLNCTDRLQPLDVNVNKPVKDFLCEKFHSWYTQNICAQLEGKMSKEPFDLRLSVVKTLGARGMVELYDFMKSKPDIIRNV